MNIVRCTRCGEIADYERRQTCGGCGEPLSAEPAGKRPRQIAPVQREANADIHFSGSLLIGIAAVAGLGTALLFITDSRFTGPFLAIGLVGAVLFPILRMMKKGGTATPGPKAAPNLRARPAAAGADESLGATLERGCGMMFKVIGIFIAVVVGFLALGFLVLWISCMSSGGLGHF